MAPSTAICSDLHAAPCLSRFGRTSTAAVLYPRGPTILGHPQHFRVAYVCSPTLASGYHSFVPSQASRPFHHSSLSPSHPETKFSHHSPRVEGLRSFSTTQTARLRDFFPAKETRLIRQTSPAWAHHGYSEEDLLGVIPAHREPRTMGDSLAWKLVRLCRWGMDFATGLRPEQQVDKKNPTTAVIASKPLTESQWLVRFVFLESIAGVPGMIAGMLRHLRSLRALKRDNGWIETLLEESYNERMHLLTFLKMCEPGWFMKMMIMGAQGVFFNAMFVCYLISPKICHRFVGYLEEEAVHTYTRCLHEIDEGQLPKWSDKKFNIPDLAIQYWNMPEEKRTMKDLILYIRADEAVHRGVNHTFSNLNQREDPNPFVSDYKEEVNGHRPKAVSKATGYEREEVIG